MRPLAPPDRKGPWGGPARLAALAAALLALPAVAATQACTVAPPAEGRFFLPVDPHLSFVSQGHRVGLWDVEHGAWQGVPLQQWTGHAAADPAGRWLVASIVDDAYRHHCGHAAGTAQEEPRARVAAADGSLRTLATDVRWLAGSAAGVAVAHGQGPDARVDVHAWGAWDAPSWTAPVRGWQGALAPSGAWLLQVDAHPTPGLSVLRVLGRDGPANATSTASVVAASFAPDASAVALLQSVRGDAQVQVLTVPGLQAMGTWAAGPGAGLALSWGAGGIAAVVAGSEAGSEAGAELVVLGPPDGAGPLALRHRVQLDAAPSSVGWLGGSVAYWSGGVRTVPLDGLEAEPSAASPSPSAGLALAAVGLAAATRGSRRN